jgi:hypothetical protein
MRMHATFYRSPFRDLIPARNPNACPALQLGLVQRLTVIATGRDQPASSAHVRDPRRFLTARLIARLFTEAPLKRGGALMGQAAKASMSWAGSYLIGEALATPSTPPRLFWSRLGKPIVDVVGLEKRRSSLPWCK